MPSDQKPKKPKPHPPPRHDKRAITDESCAQKRSSLQVRIASRYGKAETLISYGVFSITSVEMIARELRPVAKVLPSGYTVPAFVAGPTQPRNSNAITQGKFRCSTSSPNDRSDNLVTRYQR